MSALAILLPQRGYATEHNTSTSSPHSYPPPGFNAEQAKKPLPKETAPAAKPAASSQAEVNKASTPDAPTKAVANENAKNVAEEKKETKKLTIGQKIKKEVQHYWDGTKLLATEVKISSRLALKMAGGYELSRREHRQVCSSNPNRHASIL